MDFLPQKKMFKGLGYLEKPRRRAICLHLPATQKKSDEKNLRKNDNFMKTSEHIYEMDEKKLIRHIRLDGRIFVNYELTINFLDFFFQMFQNYMVMRW